MATTSAPVGGGYDEGSAPDLVSGEYATHTHTVTNIEPGDLPGMPEDAISPADNTQFPILQQQNSKFSNRHIKASGIWTYIKSKILADSDTAPATFAGSGAVVASSSGANMTVPICSDPISASVKIFTQAILTRDEAAKFVASSSGAGFMSAEDKQRLTTAAAIVPTMNSVSPYDGFSCVNGQPSSGTSTIFNTYNVKPVTKFCENLSNIIPTTMSIISDEAVSISIVSHDLHVLKTTYEPMSGDSEASYSTAKLSGYITVTSDKAFAVPSNDRLTMNMTFERFPTGCDVIEPSTLTLDGTPSVTAQLLPSTIGTGVIDVLSAMTGALRLNAPNSSGFEFPANTRQTFYII